MPFNPHSRAGYGALVKESSADTPTFPTVFFEVISENITVDWAKTPIMQVAGKVDKNMRFAQEKVVINGTVELYCEPKTLGYFLQNFFGDASSSILEADVSILHTFQSSFTDPDTFTYEFQVANSGYVRRFSGCKITGMTVTQENNLVKVSLNIEAKYTFTNARVLTEVATLNALHVDQTKGLTTSDSIIVINPTTLVTIAEYTITAVVDETHLTVSTIAHTLMVDAIVVIKAQTPTYSLLPEFTYHGGASYGMHPDMAETAAKNLEDFSIEFIREAEVFHAGAGFDIVHRMPAAIRLKSLEVKGMMKRYYDTEEFLDMLRQKEEFAIRLECRNGTALGSNAQVAATNTYGDTVNGFSVTATDALAFDGEVGNDLHVVLEIAIDDVLVAAISGHKVTVSLANTTSSNNTGTLIAAAIGALTGVDSAAEGTGAEEFITATTRKYLAGGRDEKEKAALFIDIYKCNYDPFDVEIGEDNIVTQDMNYTARHLTDGDDTGTARVRLRNNITAYT